MRDRGLWVMPWAALVTMLAPACSKSEGVGDEAVAGAAGAAGGGQDAGTTDSSTHIDLDSGPDDMT